MQNNENEINLPQIYKGIVLHFTKALYHQAMTETDEEDSYVRDLSMFHVDVECFIGRNIFLYLQQWSGWSGNVGTALV